MPCFDCEPVRRQVGKGEAVRGGSGERSEVEQFGGGRPLHQNAVFVVWSHTRLKAPS